MNTLKEHRITQKIHRMAAGADWLDTGLVFTTHTGAALDDSKVRKEFHGLLQKAELPQMRLHDLRHTCATLLIAQGVHPRVVMETLGHSQISDGPVLPRHIDHAGRGRREDGRGDWLVVANWGQNWGQPACPTGCPTRNCEVLLRIFGEPGRNRTFNLQIKRTGPTVHACPHGILQSELRRSAVRCIRRGPQLVCG